MFVNKIAKYTLSKSTSELPTALKQMSVGRGIKVKQFANILKR